MGVTLLLAVLLSQSPQAPIIVGVELRLPTGTEEALVKETPDLVALRKGQRLSVRAVQRTIERLMGTGRFADVVVFDYDALEDVSTLDEPVAYARGFEHVLINGIPVLDCGEHTGARPGRLLTR